MRLRYLLSMAVLLASASLTLAQRGGSDDVPSVLMRALKSAPKLRYSGRRVVEFKQGAEIRRHEEYVIRDGSKTRVEFPEGSRYTGQIIVEDGSYRRHYYPDKNEIHVTPPRREETYERLVKLAKRSRGHKLSTGTGETVAGFRTEQVVVTDRHGNVVQRLFIEPKTGALLKRKIFDPVGTPVGFFEFRSFDPNPRITNSLFTLSRRGAKIVTPLDILKDTAKSAGIPYRYLPGSSGYRLLSSRVFTREGQSILVQSYSSGKTRVSLFQVKGQLSDERLKHFTRGEFNTKSFYDDGWTFVLVGEIDSAKLGRLASLLVSGTDE